MVRTAGISPRRWTEHARSRPQASGFGLWALGFGSRRQAGSLVAGRPSLRNAPGFAAASGPQRRGNHALFSELPPCFGPPDLIVYIRSLWHRNETQAVGGSARCRNLPRRTFLHRRNRSMLRTSSGSIEHPTLHSAFPLPPTFVAKNRPRRQKSGVRREGARVTGTSRWRRRRSARSVPNLVAETQPGYSGQFGRKPQRLGRREEST